MTKRYLTPWTFLNWIVYFKFNINIETFKNSDQVWKQNYKLWAPGPSLGSGGKHKKRKGKQSLRILYYFCVNTLVLLLHSPPAIQNCWVLWKNWFTHRPKWHSIVYCVWAQLDDIKHFLCKYSNLITYSAANGPSEHIFRTH